MDEVSLPNPTYDVDVEHICISVLCRSGVNRSVSIARIMSHILEQTGYVCSRPRHLAFHKWMKRVLCDGTCDDCRNDSPFKIQYLNKALDVWNRV